MRRKSLPKPRDDGMMERRRSSDWKCIRVPTSSHKEFWKDPGQKLSFLMLCQALYHLELEFFF
ncbi:hypothetical protein ANCDUO_10391 [Ancylostoma duodenale]|uniref:Uncharacterized protein n=1 Tax=Ancylostoma duodenale TaxID=51022 RepID=A0A0C2GKJ6_9BILA|nr:hypothetical protein ANCDUO_10391 [Ancylostoma duodenale]